MLDGLDAQALELALAGGRRTSRPADAVDRLTATIEDAGNADLLDLDVRTARVVVGRRRRRAQRQRELDVPVHDAGDVTYLGDPDVRSDVEGAGDMHRIEP